MKYQKKTIIGSIIAFILGTSCCWLSSLAIWCGGAVFIGGIMNFMESIQSLLILVSITLAIISIYLYFRK